jgi:hypothetical protein
MNIPIIGSLFIVLGSILLLLVVRTVYMKGYATNRQDAASVLEQLSSSSLSSSCTGECHEGRFHLDGLSKTAYIPSAAMTNASWRLGTALI